MALSELKDVSTAYGLARASLVASVLSFLVAGMAFVYARSSTGGDPSVRTPESAWHRARREQTLRVGVGVVPPYTMIDPNETDPDHRYSGFCVDMVREIANRFDPPWKVEWHQVNWSTLRAEMYSGKFDFVANIIYQTPPQAADFDMTIPYSYVSVGIGVVRKGDRRFRAFADLNKPDTKISLAAGWTATKLAQRELPKATLLIKDVGDNTNIQFDDLISQRADIILQDAPTALNIAKNHADEVDLLWLDTPAMRVAAGFLLRKGDDEYREFLDVSLRSLMADGAIRRIDERWGGFGDYVENHFLPGSGLGPFLKSSEPK